MSSEPGATRLMQQMVGFVVAGLVNTAASYACYLALLVWFTHQVAYAIAYVFGIAVSYVLSARFVFRVKATLTRTLAFPLVYVFQWGLGAVILELLVVTFKLDSRIAPLLIPFLTMPVSFLLARRIMTSP